MAASNTNSTLDKKLVKDLADILNSANLSEIEYDGKDFHLRIARNIGGVSYAPVATPPAVMAAPAAAPAAASVPSAAASSATDYSSHPGVVKSPMVGVVYTAQDPKSPTFTNEGDKVTVGQTILLIEAMKTFNPVKALKAGKVVKVLVKNGQPVEYDEPLIVIE